MCSLSFLSATRTGFRLKLAPAPLQRSLHLAPNVQTTHQSLQGAPTLPESAFPKGSNVGNLTEVLQGPYQL